ncbi:MAG: hypothetical protein MUF54_02700 [Polyangiaceae bacterium]|jgi:hypothetical protein|nr:hypothetical protein [Polyangiaceae bacterium]
MDAVPHTPCYLRALSLTAGLVFALAALGCGEHETDPWRLGPVDAGRGAKDGTSEADAPIPDEPTPLGGLSRCEGAAPILGTTVEAVVRGVAAFNKEERALVTLADRIRAVQLENDCPGEPIASFGIRGEVAQSAQIAVPLAGNRVLVADAQRTVVLDSAGAQAKVCELLAGGQVRARMLAARADGSALAGFLRSPLVALTTSVADPDSCTAAELELTPEPHAIVALGVSADGGFVTVERPTPGSQLVVARYDRAGHRAGESPPHLPAGHTGLICSAAGVVDAGGHGIVVADSTCQRVLVFDAASLQATYIAEVDGSPRGVTLVADSADTALVAIARAIRGGVEASFVTLPLPKLPLL